MRSLSKQALFGALLLLGCSALLFAQNGQMALRLPAATNSALMLGAANRLVVPQGRQWRLVMAPVDARFAVGAFYRQGETIYAGTEGKGLYRSLGQDSLKFFTRKHGLAGDVVTAVTGDEKRLYVGTEGGLSIFEDPVFVTFTPENSALPGASVTHIELDGEGGVWVVTRDGGARVKADDTVEPWPLGDNAPPKYVTAISPWPQVGLAVASTQALHILYQGQWIKRTLAFTPLSVLALPQGGLALGSLDGVFYLSRVDEKPRQLGQSRGVTSLALASSQLWVSTQSGVSVVGRLGDLGLRQQSPLPRNSLDQIKVTQQRFEFSGLLRKNGSLYAFGPDGFFKRDNGQWTLLWPQSSSLAQGVVAAAVDSNDYISLVTAAGKVFTRQRGRWSEVSLQNNLDSPVVSATLSDDEGKLLLLTQRGALTEVSVR
mgnify:FL=1